MSHNTWLHKVVRRPVALLADTPVTPNQLTWARLTSALLAAGAFASNHPAAVLAGAALFVLSILLDRADGELARLTGTQSAAGHRLDLITDAISNAAVFIGIGWGAMHGYWGAAALLMALAAGTAIAAVLFMMVRMESTGGAGAANFESTAGFDPDDGMLAVPLAMAMGWGDWLIAAAAVGAPLAAFFIYFRFRRLGCDKAP